MEADIGGNSDAMEGDALSIQGLNWRREGS
ncbi:hypothetical protein M527_12870 [Sphingobium indicum IP26]|nr:hypothetical protein M527_28965 [Sphingobium indicum IP26]EPR18380.1 hypothetical protein M527_12870 [Sphingobium indicum IP26]EQB03632.1 hypothetical protein L286_11440 [Sphingobium sp. HDIP04]